MIKANELQFETKEYKKNQKEAFRHLRFIENVIKSSNDKNIKKAVWPTQKEEVNNIIINELEVNGYRVSIQPNKALFGVKYILVVEWD